MQFTGKGIALNNSGLENVEAKLGVRRAAIWAVVTVETRGFGFLPDRRPQILFERHIFRRETGGFYDASHPNISNPEAGGYIGGGNEYHRLQQAMLLNQEAALKSTSWGIAQIMGFNFGLAGYASVAAMVQDLIQDENRQLDAMANFIKANNLARALAAPNWAEFARGYNGKNYAKNRYDTRLATAFAKAQLVQPNLELRTAQAALLYLGFNPGTVDGLAGRRTRLALSAFQARHQMTRSGELDPPTQRALLAAAFPEEE
jgi:hypothetical protein